MTLGSPETSARPDDETAHQPVTFPVTARTVMPLTVQGRPRLAGSGDVTLRGER
jgi:hypothetical protein